MHTIKARRGIGHIPRTFNCIEKVIFIFLIEVPFAAQKVLLGIKLIFKKCFE